MIRTTAVVVWMVVVASACSSSGSKAPITATTASSGTAASPSTPVSAQQAPTQPPPVNPTTLDACKLLTVQDATTLAGTPMTAGTGSGPIDCHYAGPGGPAVSGTEITVRVDADAGSAHSEFPRWVQPVPGNLPGFTVTPVANLADEASETHTDLGTTHISGIFFRRGAVLVKIGSYPPASDAALRAAATVVLGRL
jgi:hypothetical protein